MKTRLFYSSPVMRSSSIMASCMAFSRLAFILRPLQTEILLLIKHLKLLTVLLTF